MDKNRFKRTSNDSTRVKRAVPKLDEMGELRNETDTIADDSIEQNISQETISKEDLVKERDQEKSRVSQIQVAAASINSTATMPSIASSPTQETNININISLPKIPEIKLKKPTLPALPSLPYKKIVIYGSVAILAIAIAVSSVILLDHHKTKPKPVVASSSSQSPNLGLTTPSFTPVAPKDKPQLARGIEGTTFDGSRDTYSFTDVLNGTPLVVSQQPIPAKYSSANDAVVAAAKSIGATTTLPTNNVTAYMVTNAKSQSQIIVFSMNGILLFIQSYFTHPASLWADYINNLS